MTRKTEQAIKVSATWTPNPAAANKINAAVFGRLSPLSVRGGRLTINAAIAIEDGKGDKVIRAYARAEELQRELEATGTVHSFTTTPGAVPAGSAERLPPLPAEDEAPAEGAAA